MQTEFTVRELIDTGFQVALCSAMADFSISLCTLFHSINQVQKMIHIQHGQCLKPHLPLSCSLQQSHFMYGLFSCSVWLEDRLSPCASCWSLSYDPLTCASPEASTHAHTHHAQRLMKASCMGSFLANNFSGEEDKYKTACNWLQNCAEMKGCRKLTGHKYKGSRLQKDRSIK